MIIDVSKHNGAVDWASMRGQVEAAIIRLGFRGYGSGTIAKDPQYDANKAGCEANGIPYSLYFFPASINDAEAHEEAQFIINEAKTCHLALPIFLDSEVAEVKRNSGRADKLDKATRTHLLKVIQDDIKAAGFECGVYASESWFNNFLDASQLAPLWVAKYGTNDGVAHVEPVVQGNSILWQYTSNAPVGNLGRADASIRINGYQFDSASPQPTPTPAPAPGPVVDAHKALVALGQAHANNFAQCGLVTDGIRGNNTREGAIKVLQRGLNVDYNAQISESGELDTATLKAFGKHYVKRGETQYMVTALEILLLLKGIDPKGVECPGVFGEGLENAVGAYQSAVGLNHDNIAGYNTFISLVQ